MSWRKYAYIAKEKGLDTLYNAMVANDPSIGENYEIKYTVTNSIQLGFITSNETEIIGFLRKSLNNWGIHLNLKEETTKAEQLYTSKAIFEEMIKRNPDLENLRKTFNLDIGI